jgi:hemerythrin-like domain-containing protein
MKRHDALVRLSREHHSALKIARQARLSCEAGQDAGLARTAATIRDNFAVEMEPHFQVEEADLLPALARAGAGELVERTLAEHAELRDLICRLAEPDLETMARFAGLLVDHVRFEERELFETAQRLLYPEP